MHGCLQPPAAERLPNCAHGATERPELRANRIGIDTGAYATGRLTCLVLEGEEAGFLLPRQDRASA